MLLIRLAALGFPSSCFLESTFDNWVQHITDDPTSTVVLGGNAR
jgi:hypothetical protein